MKLKINKILAVGLTINVCTKALIVNDHLADFSKTIPHRQGHKSRKDHSSFLQPREESEDHADVDDVLVQPEAEFVNPQAPPENVVGMVWKRKIEPSVSPSGD